MILESKTFEFKRANGLTIVVDEQLKDNGKGRFWTDKVFLIKDGQKHEAQLDRFSPEESAFYCKGFAKQTGASLSQRFNVRDLFTPVFEYKREIREKAGKERQEIEDKHNHFEEVHAL